jgi:hypothetical protein
MKLTHDENGNILAVAIDSQTLSEPFVTLADNTDILMNPGRYLYNIGLEVVEKRRYLVVTAGAQTGSTIPLTITAYDADDVADTTASDLVAVSIMGPAYMQPIYGSPVALVSGVASIDLTATSPGTMQVVANADGMFGGSLGVVFS